MTHLPPALPPHLEGQTTWLSKTTSARVLGNPLVWSAMTALFILAGYVWLEYYARPYSENLEQSRNDEELIGAARRGEWNPEIYRNIESQELMSITQQADALRAEHYRTEINHQNQIQPLLTQARDFLESENYIGPDKNNAWRVYQNILEIDPEHKIALSGQAQVISILQENAEFATDEEQYVEAELWLNQLDSIKPDALFQSELRQLIADRISEAVALEEAAQQKAERDKLLAAALQDAATAMLIEPPELRAAYDLYQRVLELDEANSAATSGLTDIHKKRIETAKVAIADAQYDAAQIQIDRLRQTSADKTVVEHLATELEITKSRPPEPEAKAPTEAVSSPASMPEAEPAPAPVPQTTSEPETASTPPAKPETLKPAPAETTIVIENSSPPVEVNEIKVRPRSASSSVQSISNQNVTDPKTQLSNGVNAYYSGDYRTAFAILHPLAEDNISRAQFRLGMMYYQGRTVVKNEDLARQWIARALPAILRAAQNGTAWAQADLGTAYELGVGVARDPGRAASWYQKSATQGYAGAQANLGVLYGNGSGVKYDRQIALHWLKKAAAQGDRIAQDNLKILNAR